jgi:uncharacterized protein
MLIRLYWRLIPASKRKQCIFRKSCSQFVFDTTYQQGALEGLKAFRYRYNNCRGGYETFRSPVNGKMQMILPDGIVIDEKEIAVRLL